jgi:FKBP-type peptidyl-prolyl cis-trans isomerase FkpA
MPPFFKKGHYILTTLKIVNVFATKDLADKARAISMVEMEKRDSLQAIAQKGIDEKKLLEYISKNNIKTVKAPLGTFVEITQEGTGNMIDTGVIVKVNYTGKTLEGKVFDSNTDPAKGHVEPLLVNMTNINNPAFGMPVITGMKEGLSLLKKGSKAKLYIPSTLGYGKTGSGADIGPNSILIFDIEVLDVLNQIQALAEFEEKNKKMQEVQKRYMDSVQKLKPDSSGKK